MALRSLRRLIHAAALCTAAAAHAETRTSDGAISVALDYSPAPGCPDTAEFKAIVIRQLDHDPFATTAEDRAIVSMAAEPHALDGRIEWRNVQEKLLGDRVFRSRGSDCHDLARAMAFALALEIQFLAIAKTQPPAQPPVVTEPIHTAPPPAKPARAFSIAAGGFAGFAMSSALVPFGRLAAASAGPRWSIELSAEVAWPTKTRRDDGAGYSQQLILAGLAGCRRLHRLAACALAKAGEVRVVGRIDSPRSAAGLVLQAGLRVAIDQDLGRRAYLSVHADGLINLRPWKVALDQDVVWSSPIFAEAVGLDLGLRFE